MRKAGSRRSDGARPFAYPDPMDVHGGRSRLTWVDLPAHVHARIETLVGGTVVHAETALGGFSPGLASTLTLADERVVFVKAVATRTGPGSSDLLRRERDNLRRLGPRPFTSRMIASDDDGDWVVVAFEHVAGRAPVPSVGAERARMIRAFEEAAASLTPSPIEAPTFAATGAGDLDGWARTAADDAAAVVVPWIAANLDAVRTLAEGWRDASAGDSLVHGDLRADNMLLSGDAVVIVDWTDISLGAPWLDWVCAVPSVCLFAGTPPPEQTFQESALAAAADPAMVTAVLAAVAGYFLCSAVKPVVPALPTLREFQRAQGLVAADWLRTRVEGGLV